MAASKLRMIAGPIGLIAEVEQFPHAGRPFHKIRTVGMEHRDRQAIHSERHAARMGRLTVCVLDIPGRAEMVAVVVEAHTSRRLLFRAQRDQKLKLQ